MQEEQTFSQVSGWPNFQAIHVYYVLEERYRPQEWQLCGPQMGSEEHQQNQNPQNMFIVLYLV